MALEDIKKAILTEAEKQADSIIQSTQENLGQIKAAWATKIEVKEKEIINIAQHKADQKVQQTQFRIRAQAQTQVLNQKHKLIDQVYKLAQKKLTELNDAEYTKLMEKLISQLPKNEGKIMSPKDKADLLKKALKNNGQKYELVAEAIRTDGGFIFQSKEVEVNQTFIALVQGTKEKTILAVTKKLFDEPIEKE